MPGNEKVRVNGHLTTRQLSFHPDDLAKLNLVAGKIPKPYYGGLVTNLGKLQRINVTEDVALTEGTPSDKQVLITTEPETVSPEVDSDCETELGDVNQNGTATFTPSSTKDSTFTRTTTMTTFTTSASTTKDASRTSISSSTMPKREVDDYHDLIAVGCRLYLKRCKETGVVPISMLIRNFANPVINLASHQCGTKGVVALSSALWYIRHLRVLDLSDNNIKDAGVKHLVPRLVEHDNLKELVLSENRLTSEGVRWICQLINVNKVIRNISIKGNHLGDSAAKLIAEMLEMGDCLLTDLNLSNNDFGEEAGLLLGPAIGENLHLERLDLSWNHIRKKGAVAIAKGIKENSKLESINLGWNGFGMEGAEALGGALAGNTTLLRLDLTSNRLTDQDIMLFCQGFYQNETLQKLNMVTNLFSHNGAMAILKSVQNNQKSSLVFLDMQGVVVKQEFVNNLKALQTERTLEVKYNKFIPRKYEDPIKTIVHFIIDSNKRLNQIFIGITEDSEDNKCVTKEEFVDKLKAVNVPLSEQQLNDLATKIDKQERGLIDISSLFKMEAKIARISPKT